MQRTNTFFLVSWGGLRLSLLGWEIMMKVEQSVEWKFEGETEVLVENFLQCHFVHHKSHMIRPGLETGSPRWEAGE
jgi:hypothetical protein